MAPMTTSGSNSPSPFWKGASWGLVVASVAVSGLTATFLGTGLPRILEAAVGALAGAVVFGALFAAIWVAFRLIGLAPRGFIYYLLAAIGVFIVLRSTRFRWDPTLFYTSMALFWAPRRF